MLALKWTLLLMTHMGCCSCWNTRRTNSLVDGFWINRGISPEFVQYIIPDQMPRIKKTQVRGFQTSDPSPSSVPESHDWINPEFVFPDQLPRLRKQARGFTTSDLDTSASESSSETSASAWPPISSAVFVPMGCSGLDEDYCEKPLDYPDISFITEQVKNKTTKVEAELIFGQRQDLGDQRQNLGVPLGFGRPRDRLPPNRSQITSNEKPVPRNTVETEDDPNYEVDFIEEAPVCDSRESFVFPRTARNLDKKWRFVINVPRDETGDEEYVQAVRVERCLRPGRRCNIESLTGSETVCRQKYTLRRLLALSDNGEQFIDSFRFPSCCVCYEKKNFGMDQWGFLKKRENIKEGKISRNLEGEKSSRRYNHQNSIHTFSNTRKSINYIPPS